MNQDALLVTGLHPVHAVTMSQFAGLIGKPESAIQEMVKQHKLPVVELRDPKKPNSRAEKWVYLPEFNRAMHEAFQNRPKEQRDAWLLWLGL